MATAKIVKAWKAGGNAHLAARVGDTEYLVSTPLKDDAGKAKTIAKLKAELRSALKAKRTAQVGGPTGFSWSGSLEV